MHTYNPRTQEVGEGRSEVQSYPQFMQYAMGCIETTKNNNQFKTL